jgi:hypothetical protein
MGANDTSRCPAHFLLRAVVSKYRLRCVKYEKSKSLKIFQNKGLWEVFKEK